MSSRAYESLPPERQTMTLSPSSIMLKSLMARPVSRIRRLLSLLASWRSRFRRRASSAEAGFESRVVLVSACMVLWREDKSAAALQLNADGGAIRKGQGFADSDAHVSDFGEVSKDAGDKLLGQCFQQMHMATCALVHQRVAQFAVIQHGLDVIVLHFFGNFHIEFCIDMQRLCGAQFVFKDADACIQGELFKNNTAGEHRGVLKWGRRRKARAMNFIQGCRVLTRGTVLYGSMLKSRSIPTRC